MAPKRVLMHAKWAYPRGRPPRFVWSDWVALHFIAAWWRVAPVLLAKMGRFGRLASNTTSSFTKESLGYASALAIKVVLLDGLALTNLMIDDGVGVTTESVYEVKRVDSDYFDLP
jgi:hypothetical protein